MKSVSPRSGFTLLELLTVMAIIAVLFALTLPAISLVQGRSERAQCINNLRSLYVAASAYVQEHKQWPQIQPALAAKDHEAYALRWNEALQPFGIARKNWICPTAQKLLGAPDYQKDVSARVDYRAMPFDKNPETPYKWPRQPWFVESGNVHGNGQLLICTDGSVREMDDLIVRKINGLREVGK